MHFTSLGQGDPAIVFVHGFACDATDWQAILARLQDELTVIACDLPGHGASPGSVADCSIEAYGANVAQLLTDLNLRQAVLVGHSMGCRVVLEAYAVAPERVAGVVLLDGSFIGTGDRREAELGMAHQLESDTYEGFVREFFGAMFVDSADEEFKAAIVDRALRLPKASGSALMTNLAGWDAARMSGALAAVRCPLMVIQCTSLTPERLRVSLTAGESSPWLDLVRQHAPTAHLEMLLDNGHFPHLEEPEEVADLIRDFTSGLKPSTS